MRQGRGGEIGASAARDDGGNANIRLSGCHQGGRGTGACPEVVNRKQVRWLEASSPLGRCCEPLGQQWYVEDIGTISCLAFGQKIEEKGCKPSLSERFCHISVAGTGPAAAATMGEDDETLWAVAGQTEAALEAERRHENGLFVIELRRHDCLPRVHHIPHANRRERIDRYQREHEAPQRRSWLKLIV